MQDMLTYIIVILASLYLLIKLRSAWGDKSESGAGCSSCGCQKPKDPLEQLRKVSDKR